MRDRRWFVAWGFVGALVVTAAAAQTTNVQQTVDAVNTRRTALGQVGVSRNLTGAEAKIRVDGRDSATLSPSERKALAKALLQDMRAASTSIDRAITSASQRGDTKLVECLQAAGKAVNAEIAAAEGVNAEANWNRTGTPSAPGDYSVIRAHAIKAKAAADGARSCPVAKAASESKNATSVDGNMATEGQSADVFAGIQMPTIVLPPPCESCVR